ncbi:MAG: cytochrome ubiquinol oxidase subunit I [Chloroflexi bacterium]|nr:cytochrome ubiquinol oxidase subunit I [Chloroflexota bacterium]
MSAHQRSEIAHSKAAGFDAGKRWFGDHRPAFASTGRWPAAFFLLLGVSLLSPLLALAQEGGTDYRQAFGLDSRTVVWIIAELHLMFGAFVLGVPIFAVIMEIIGVRTGDPRYDRLARDFTRLLSAAFATTAALGGLMSFALFSLYPRFMATMTDAFHPTFYLYAACFFGETFSLYFYYYSWDRLKGGKKKAFHVGIGVLLNLMGTAIMLISSSWASFMMSPAGFNKAGQFVGTTLQAVWNPLWIPLNIHRLLGNVVFGGLVAGAYAAIKFLGAKTDEERAHYDWMGYIGNFVALSAIIPLPFAGYYFGREVYSTSPVMGNNMMGGAFSWTFILQAMLVGMLFILGNYYLWVGMGRIPGAERYQKYIKYINFVLLISFAVWLTPHNLPLSAEEQVRMGGQYHPVLKYLGLMSAKNAVVNFIILSTFFSFLLYRRGNKGLTIPFSRQGKGAKVVLGLVVVLCALFLSYYAHYLLTLDPVRLDLAPEKAGYFMLPAGLLLLQIGLVLAGVTLTFMDRGKLAQALLFALTTVSVVFVLGVYGFIVMTGANPFLRNIAVVQVLLMLSALLTITAIDIFLFRGAEVIGELRWGKMPARSQYVLILLCVIIVLTMGIMGFIRSGLREDWHIYGVLQDTSSWAFTPTNAYAARVIGGIVLTFLGLISFVFWLSELGEKKAEEPGSRGARELETIEAKVQRS